MVEILSGWRTSKSKRFIVTRIIAPFGPPIDERPPVPTAEERELEHALGRKAKHERKFLRHHTERLTSKLAQAEKVTGEIMRLAAELNLVKAEAAPVKAAVAKKTTPVKSTPAKTASIQTGSGNVPRRPKSTSRQQK